MTSQQTGISKIAACYGVLCVAVVLPGCSSLQQRSTLAKLQGAPESACLTEEFETLRDDLLLMPYTKRNELLALYGKPQSTTTNSARMIVDTHHPRKGLVLETYWTASDPNKYDSLQWAEFNIVDAPAARELPWRFDKWPEPVPDVRVLRCKVALLRQLEERLIRQSTSETHTDTFMNGDLTRTFVVKEHFDLHVGQEVWAYKGVTVAEGRYRDNRPWSGTFLRQIYNTETFRQVTYEDGVLLHSIIPEWGKVNDSGQFIAPFVQGSVSDFSLDDTAFLANSNILSLAHQNGFLEWVNKHAVTEGYRVVVSPSFSPAIVFNVILESSTAQPSVEWIVTDGKAGYPDTMTTIASQSERRLSSAEVRDIQRTVTRSLFWGNQKEHSIGACDGWFLDYEGLLDRQYTYRHYFNSDATASEALAHKLLAMVPREEAYRGLGQPVDSYMWNLRNCTEDAIRLLEHAAHPEIVDELIFDASAEHLAHCIRKAKELARHESKKLILTGDFDALSWDRQGRLLVHPNGDLVSARSRKEVAVWDNSWMYDITLGAGAETNGTTKVTVKFTPSATIALFRRTAQTEALSPTALKILRFLDLNPELATVIDWGTKWTKKADDDVEDILVVPPQSLAGAYSYTVAINHTKRSYSVSRGGGIGGGGSLYSRNFKENW